MKKSKNESISIYSLLLYSMVFYTLVTLTYKFIPNVPLNRFFAMCVALIILYLYLQKLTIKRVIILLFCLFFSLYTMLVSEVPSDNLNDLLWMITTILIIGIATDKKFYIGLNQAIDSNKKKVKIIIVIIEVILLIAVFTPSSYGNEWGWGEEASYFVGFATNGHTLASTCCLLIVLIMVVFNEKKINLIEYLFYLLPLYGVLFSGARTFLISVLILIVINVYIKKNSILTRNITLMTVITLFIFAFVNSSMLSKFEFASSNEYAKNMLDSITNGRSEFWTLDLELFLSSHFFIQLFGRGFDYIYGYNLQKIGVEIWAHNDIINNLIAVGIIGTLFYIGVWLKYINNFSKNDFLNDKLIIILLFTLYIVVPMLVNGLYPYQHYVFSCVLLGQTLSIRSKLEY